jgi:hypothetical protein
LTQEGVPGCCIRCKSTRSLRQRLRIQNTAAPTQSRDVILTMKLEKRFFKAGL